ncbi:MAG: radical SAM protein [Prevotella sp.]|nr:radical SAM protein [Prevotella sp.]MDD4533634.1 radical SAM protein [Prevotella sp.]
MSTILHDSPIYGPIHSRRLGLSLGINLMPADGKICTFDCLYCECGFNADRRPKSHSPSRKDVLRALEQRLVMMEQEGELPDVMTFAGNGEPTTHKEFPEIIDDVISLRDRLCPSTKISVLSNATFVHDTAIRAALMKVDNNIQKLDTVNEDYIRRVDRPTGHSFSVGKVINNLKLFGGHVIIQTMFMQGNDSDNTNDFYVEPWLKVLEEIRPQSVMIYTIDRETPDHGLKKVSREKLDAICSRVHEIGIPCTASY